MFVARTYAEALTEKSSDELYEYDPLSFHLMLQATNA